MRYDGTMPKRGFNPFYVLLVIVGIAFSITAFAYFVMTLRDAQAAGVVDPKGAGAPLLAFLDRYGTMAMAVELVLLALATVGAISTDRYWMRRGGSNGHSE